MTTRTTCNRPKVKDGFLLGRLIRRKWVPVPRLCIEICGGCISIEGDCWPEIYRIPHDIDPSMAYPGMKGMTPPIEIGWLLIDVAPYLLDDRLIVTATDDTSECRWVIRADSPIIEQYADQMIK